MAGRGLLLALDYPPAPGGIARLLDGWIVDTEEIEWMVLTTTLGARSERVERTSMRTMAKAAVLRGRPWLRQADKRVVVAGHPYLSGLALAIAKGSGARSAAIAYGLELVPRRLRYRLAVAPLLGLDVVVSISGHTAQLLRKAGVRRSRTAVVRPCLRPLWLATSVTRRRPTDGLRLVALTRLTEGYKNLEMLIRLCAVLHPVGAVERLTIIGGGPRLAALREKVATLGLSDVVRFPGHLPENEVREELATAHVGLFPSRSSMAEGGFEGFGLAVHELAAAGLPVLVGAAAGAIEAGHRPWARVFDPDDLWAWVEAVESLFANEDQRRAMGAAALRWANAIDPLDSTRKFAGALLPRRDSSQEGTT